MPDTEKVAGKYCQVPVLMNLTFWMRTHKINRYTS